MDLFYCKIDTGNFGDDMNAWFWQDVFPEYPDVFPDTTMFGIGSLLWRDNIEAFDKILVMGSGTGVGTIPKVLPDHLHFAWVRGPMTAAEMGLPPEAAVSDGAILCPRLPRFAGAGAARGGAIFVPHCGTERLALDWPGITARAGLELVSPAQDAETVIRRIAGAELVVAESMHAAILADAFRVPWVPLALSPAFNYFKWKDWGRSVDTEFAVQNGLAAFKSAYGALRRIRQRLRGQGRPITAHEDPTSQIRVPNLDMPERNRDLDLHAIGKDRARTLVRRFAPLVERSITADLRRAKRGRSYLSPDAAMTRRQDQLEERIDRLRRGEFPRW